MNKMEEYIGRIEEYLAGCFDESDALRRAMRYSLLSGGKHIRPVLTLEFCRVCGGDAAAALPVACGVEMLHCYSLIHDDLPCMDDDDTRRGKPACHIAFGETVATLAGDCLQAEAFASICRADIPADRRMRCCQLLAGAAGADGICGGQLLDLSEPADEAALLKTDLGKTAALIAAACAMGAAAAGADEDKIAAAKQFGTQLGLAFQLRDDALDGDGFFRLLGSEKCEERIGEYTAAALHALDNFENTDFLANFARDLAGRFT